MDTSASSPLDSERYLWKGTSMKKFALAVMAASAVVFGSGLPAQAQTPSYSTSVTVGPVTSGGPYTVDYVNCVPGETITFSQPESTPTSVTAVCPGEGTVGTATASFANAPTAPGDYTVTATGTQSPTRTTTFSLAGAGVTVPATVPEAGLPATGSDGVGATTGVALGLLAVGLGLFVVAQIRRRQPVVG
jgi:hypothetical protein